MKRNIKVKWITTLLSIAFIICGICPSAIASSSVGTADALKSAFDNAGSGVTEIVLSDDIAFSSTTKTKLTCASGKTIVLDLNNHTVTFPHELSLFNVVGGSLTIKNGTIKNTADGACFSVTESGSLTLENVNATVLDAWVIYAENSEVMLNGISLSTISTDDDCLSLLGTATAVNGKGESITNGKTISNTYVAQSQKTNKETNLTATVAETYLITVPQTIEFGDNITYTDVAADKYVEKTGTITVDYLVSDGKTLNVTVKGSGTNGAFTLANSKSQTLNYLVFNSSDVQVSTGGTIAQFTQAGNKSFKVKLDRSSVQYSGTYSGKLLFEISVQ